MLALLAAGSDGLSVVSSYKSYKSRRHLLSSLTFGAAGAAALLAPNAAFASGVNLLHFLERAWAGRTQGHRVKFWCNEERIWVRLHPRALRVECKW